MALTPMTNCYILFSLGHSLAWKPSGIVQYSNLSKTTWSMKEFFIIHQEKEEFQCVSFSNVIFLGSLLASTIRHPSKYLVQFFEKNGLCHGDFQPVFGKDGKNVAVHSLSWNIESTILMICASEDTQDYVQLWTCSNYKWKLKKGWTLAKNHVIDALWDPENPHRWKV